MSNEEIFDIFDREMNLLGQASRKQVHESGLWHRTFHCWVVTTPHGGERSLLFQLRHPGKDTYPNMLDVSCGGHLLAGETVADGVRELEEELGLSVEADKLTLIGMTAEEGRPANGLIDREFNHIHLYVDNRPPGSYSFQTSEITGLFHVKLSDYRELVAGIRSAVTAEGVILDGPCPAPGSNRIPVVRTVGRDDFVPKSEAYFKLLFSRLEEDLISGDR